MSRDAPLDSRELKRLAARSLLGMARTGSSASNGSGDYSIAFSTAPAVRIHTEDKALTGCPGGESLRARPLRCIGLAGAGAAL